MATDTATSSDGSKMEEGKTVRAGEVMTYSPWWPWSTGRTDPWSAFCWKKKRGLKTCAKCHFCYYCDAGCQYEDWRRERKRECNMLQCVDKYLVGPFGLHVLFLKMLNRFAEAEASPIKFTPSCIQPIPSDERAQLPCPQCGALNGHRLSLAKIQLDEFSGKFIDVSDAVAWENGRRPNFLVKTKRELLLDEMDKPRVVLHPHNSIRLGIMERSLKTVLTRKLSERPEGRRHDIRRCDDLTNVLCIFRDYSTLGRRIRITDSVSGFLATLESDSSDRYDAISILQDVTEKSKALWKRFISSRR